MFSSVHTVTEILPSQMRLIIFHFISPSILKNDVYLLATSARGVLEVDFLN